MLCKIADLTVNVPAAGNLPQRCQKYRCFSDNASCDIVIPQSVLQSQLYPTLSESDNYYLETGFCFYRNLLSYNGIMLHASCVVVENRAYLFSGPSGVGKSTHSSKYLHTFEGAFILNDDKPALRRMDGRWTAYGTPWCGKDGINENRKAEVAGICFLKQGDREIKRLSPLEALPELLMQTVERYTAEDATLLMKHLDLLIREVPIFSFTNHADAGDEQITYNTMKQEGFLS